MQPSVFSRKNGGDESASPKGISETQILLMMEQMYDLCQYLDYEWVSRELYGSKKWNLVYVAAYHKFMTINSPGPLPERNTREWDQLEKREANLADKDVRQSFKHLYLDNVRAAYEKANRELVLKRLKQHNIHNIFED